MIFDFPQIYVFDLSWIAILTGGIISLLGTALSLSLLGAVALFLIKIGVHCFQEDESARHRVLALLNPNIRRCLLVAGFSLALSLGLLVFVFLFSSFQFGQPFNYIVGTCFH